jgi:hypothetical protein
MSIEHFLCKVENVLFVVGEATRPDSLAQRLDGPPAGGKTVALIGSGNR